MSLRQAHPAIRVRPRDNARRSSRADRAACRRFRAPFRNSISQGRRACALSVVPGEAAGRRRAWLHRQTPIFARMVRVHSGARSMTASVRRNVRVSEGSAGTSAVNSTRLRASSSKAPLTLTGGCLRCSGARLLETSALVSITNRGAACVFRTGALFSEVAGKLIIFRAPRTPRGSIVQAS
jgi:hypothetical protein